MPTDEHSRTEYLRSLLNQQRQINATGGNLLNPAIPNEGGSLGAQAALDTSMQGGSVNPDVLTYDPSKEEKSGFEQAIDKIFGFADEIAAQFGAGFVGAFEGILDFAATGLGALGDATGWYSSDPFTEWSKKDLGRDAATYIKTYLTPWNDIRNMANGNYWTEDYWNGRLKGAANVLSLGTAYDDEIDMDKEHDKYYGFRDGFDTGFGEFLGGAAYSVGFMLPSIIIGVATGGATAGATASSIASKAASLGTMFLSASGKGAEEALNEGASAGQALGYGTATGAVEVASEIVVGKALGLVGLGTGKIMGVIGNGTAKTAAKVGSKVFIKELGKTMFEEGMEEVFSAVMEPVTKAIYKGESAFEGTYSNPDWWFGTDGHFNESVVGQFTSGAFVGGLTGGIQMGKVAKKVGSKGYSTISAMQTLVEADAEMSKLEKKGITSGEAYEKASQKRAEAMSAFIEAENSFLETATESQKKNLAKMLTTPNSIAEFGEALKAENVSESLTKYIQSQQESIRTHERAQISSFLSDVQSKYGSEVRLRFGALEGKVADFDPKTNTITLTEQALSGNGGKAIVHEYFGHALSMSMSSGTRAMLYQEIVEADPQLLKEVEKAYPELDRSSAEMREEVIANFLGEQFSRSNSAQTLEAARKLFGNRTLWERIMQSFDQTAKTQKGKVLKEYGKTLNQFLKKAGDERIIRAVAKEMAGEKLSKGEQTLKEKFSNVFDALKQAIKGDERQVTAFASKELFKSIETTRNIVEDTKTLIEDYLNTKGNGETKDYRLVFPHGFRDFSSKAFTEINGVKSVSLEAAKLIETLKGTYIEERLKNGGYAELGTLSDMMGKAEFDALKGIVEDIIKSSPDSEARSKATKTFEMRLNKALDQARDNKNRISRARVMRGARDSVRRIIDHYLEVTDDMRAKEGLYTLLQPFAKLSGSSNDGFKLWHKDGDSRRAFRDDVKAALDWYTEENLSFNPTKEGQDFSDVPFDPEVRQALIDVYESLPGEAKGNLSTESLQLSLRAMNMIRRLINKMHVDYTTKVRPAARQSFLSINSSGYRTRMNLIAKLYRMYKRGFAPAYVVINQMLGENSVLAKTLTFDMQMALNGQQLYKGGYADLINKKLKELGIKKTLDKARFKVGSHDLTADQAMFLYNALSTQANFDAINESGISYHDKNGNTVKVSEVGRAAELKAEVEKTLPDEYKKLAEFLKTTLNDSVKKEYMKMYEDRYGKYQHRNEIGKVGDQSYWMLFRLVSRMSSAEKAVSNPSAMFSHASSRVKNTNPVMLAGALSSFDSYIDQLSREMFVKPKYREVLAMLNMQVDGKENVMSLLARKVDVQDMKYLRTTLSDLLGANPYGKGNDVFSKAMSTFSVAKLSLNMGTMLKQFASIWTSNIPMRKSIKGFFSNIFKSDAVKAEYKQLVNELGGLKYRESGKGIIRANADALGAITEKAAQIGMIGISKVDLFTISTGVVSLMHIAQDQMGYKIGTAENAQWVKEHWAEFELSQIGGGSLSKNAVQRGDYKQLPRLLFGFLQGANRAALGSQLNKIGLWKRNHGLDFKTLQKTLTEAKATMESAKAEYDADSENAEKADAYIQAQTEYLDAEAKANDYQRFQTAGGRAIPVHMAAGLMAQGLFVAMINELMKHIKGKKDWDEWDMLEMSGNVLSATFLDWIPFVNTISGMAIKGNEVSIPPVEIMNQIVDVISNAKEGDWQASLRQLALLLGDTTGIPVQTLYQYMYGAMKIFDPELAYRMNSVFYGSSLSSANKTYGKLVDKGDVASSKKMLVSIFRDYKTGYMSDMVAERITRLKMAGYDVSVKGYMTEYTDDAGKTVQLSAQQIQMFKLAYSQSDKAVRDLMNTGEFQSAMQEEQAALIKKIYDAYYGYAKAKVTGSSESKLAALLAGTNGNLMVGKFIAMLAKMNSIKDNGKKSRKELVFDYVNSRSLSKAEKTLLLYLAGYGLNDASKKTVRSYLSSKGMQPKKIAEFLGEK